jgi:SPP1 gp7 family putative phage head morphogenesis protein
MRAMRGERSGGSDPGGYWFRGWSPFFDPREGQRGFGLLGRGAHVGFEAARRAALRARRAETQFAQQLRHIARAIGQIVNGTADPDNPHQWITVAQALEDYGRLITPWATATSTRMLAEVSRRDVAGWHEIGRTINRALAQEIATAPIGPTLQQLLADQVHLITSLPREAAERVHQLSLEAVTGGRRWEEIAEDLAASGQVSLGRANLIARTETGRAATALMQVRATHLGSEGYVWRTARDRDVRPLHKRLEGSYHRWDDPPVAGERGELAHPGAIYNCFPGSTKVSLSNGCHHLWRRWYKGRLRVVELETGASFAVTPNHPILVGRGWTAAEEIQIGDDLIQFLGDTALAVEDDKHYGQPTFDDLFTTLDLLVGRKTEVGLHFNFHGERPDNDVDAITADHLLPGNGPSELFERIGNFTLAGTDGRMAAVGIERGRFHIGEALLSRECDQSLASLGRHRLHAAYIGLTARATQHAMSLKNVCNSNAAAAKAQRNGKFAFARLVGADNISFRKVFVSVNIRRATPDLDPARLQTLAQSIPRARPQARQFAANFLQARPFGIELCRVVDCGFRNFEGHVYTMETANGWFTVTSAGLVVKNCRCFPEVVLPGAEPRLGPLPRNPEYLAALRAQGYTTGAAFE